MCLVLRHRLTLPKLSVWLLKSIPFSSFKLREIKTKTLHIEAAFQRYWLEFFVVIWDIFPLQKPECTLCPLTITDK